MDTRTVVAFLVGVGLAASCFLLLGRDGERGTEPAGFHDAGTRREPGPETQPTLRGADADPLTALAPSEEEVEWIKGALRTERKRRDAARIREGDTGLQVMARVFKYDADPAALLRSYEAFRAPIVETDETPLALSEPRAGETVSFKDGDVNRVVIELGPGVFPIAKSDQHWRPVYSLDKKVTHVVIRGAGMDRTTLVAGHQWALLLVAGTVEHLVIRDLTLDGGEAEGALLDIRGQAAVALENVRVKGWLRAGHAAAISVSGSAYLGCKGCEFLGRGEQSGWAISLRGRSLLLCEDCRFQHVGRGALIGTGEKTAGSSAVLRDCTFEASRLSDRRFSFPVRVLGGRVMYGSADLDEDDRRSHWGAGHAERVEGVVFEPIPPVCTLGALLDVLEKVEPPEGERVVGIWLDGVADGRPSKFRVYTLPATGRRTKTYEADVSGGWPTLRHLERDGGRGIPPPDVVRRARSFVDVLRGSAVPLDIGVSRLQYSWQGGDQPIPTIAIGTSKQSNRWYFNAESGELMRGPK